MRICIERTDRLGDMILTLPVIQGIKEKNPEASIDVVASKKNLKICQLSNLIDKILTCFSWVFFFHKVFSN